VVFIYTVSGLVRDGRSNGGGRRQLLGVSEWLGGSGGGGINVEQRCSNYFQVGTTFISQNVLRSPLLLSPLKANCLRFSTIV
jgi:hypothetical protein